MPTFSWLPQPLLSLVLLLTWLLLSNSVAPGHIVLGALLGLLIPPLTHVFWPDRPRMRRPGVFVRFVATVLVDILIANLVVAKLILFRAPGSYRSRFVRLPLDLKSEFAVALLANTISLTPGTVSVDPELERKDQRNILAQRRKDAERVGAEPEPDRRYLLIHALEVDDEAALIAEIKTRYEAPLKTVFESC